MRKLFVLFLILSVNSVSAKTDTLRVYTWEEAQKTDPKIVFAISLEKMKLETVPVDLAKFKNLKKLNLSKNKLKELPDFISSFDSLQELDLYRNQLNLFPVQLCQMKSIKRLILARNGFEQIPACIKYMENLNYLDLSDTPVGSFPEAFVEMKHLKTLVLHGLAYAPTFQVRWKERLSWMRIEFDPPCNCFE